MCGRGLRNLTTQQPLVFGSSDAIRAAFLLFTLGLAVNVLVELPTLFVRGGIHDLLTFLRTILLFEPAFNLFSSFCLWHFNLLLLAVVVTSPKVPSPARNYFSWAALVSLGRALLLT